MDNFEDNENVLSAYIEPCGENILDVKSNNLSILTFYCANGKDHVGDHSYSMSFNQNDEDVTITVTKSKKYVECNGKADCKIHFATWDH